MERAKIPPAGPSSEEKTSPSGSNCVTPGPIVLTLSSKAYQVIDSSLPGAAKVSLVGKFGHIKLAKELFPAKFWKVPVQFVSKIGDAN